MNLKREELVLKNFKITKNCAEAIILAFQDKISLEEKDIKSITAGFERGMFISDTCGVVTGSVMLLGIIYNDDNVLAIFNKRKIAKKIGKFTDEFRKKNMSLNCKELKKTYKKNCNNLLIEAVKILDEIID